MQKLFYKNLFWLILTNLIIKPVSIFLIDAQVQNKVGSNQYGLYFSLLSISYVFSVFLDFGLSNYSVKKITKNTSSLSFYLGSSILFRLFLLIVCAIVLGFLSFVLSYPNEYKLLLFWIFFNQFLISTIAFLRSFYTGLLWFKMEIILSVLDKIFWIIILGYWIYFLPKKELSIHGFVAVQTVSYFIVFFIAFIVLIKKIGLPKLKWNWKWSFQILKKSYPYALLVFLMMIYNRIDGVLLERISGSNEAGIYAQSFRLLDACFMFAGLFSSLLFPLFSKMIHLKENILPLLQSSQFVLFSFSVLIANICFFYDTEIIEVLYVHDKISSIKVLSILMLGLIPISFTLIQGTLLTASSHLKFLNTMSFFGIIINLGLNFFLIKKYGAYGAAFSALITQSVLAFLQIIKVQRCFLNKKYFQNYLQYFFILFFSFVLFYLLDLFLNPVLGVLVSSILYLFLLFYIKKKELIFIINQFVR
ncbi:MAG: oligosaccharide flippase family protein [Flavobacteriia bacterium]|nr:oligosaccharide flippase family protein [Flavobacteriia bacterium]